MLRRILVMPLVYGLLVIFAACAQPGALVTPTAAPPIPTTTSAALTAVPPTVTTVPTEVPTETSAAPTSTPVLEALDTTTTTTTSPDGAWVAVAAVGFPTTKDGAACTGCRDQYFVRLTVQRTDGGQAWTPLAEWRPMGLGYTTPATLQWSADGAALYYTNVAHPDGCGFFGSNGSDLLRLDLASGAVSELMPANAYYLVLSPDETQVAYLAYGQRGLVVRDLATGAERDYPLADLGGPAVAAVWSPDASALALTVQSDLCGGSDLTQMVIEVKLADGARRVLLPPGDQRLTTVAWPAAGQLRLVDPDGRFWALDIATGQVTPEG